MQECMSESCAKFGDETPAGSETKKKKGLRVMVEKGLGAACCVEAYLLSLLCMHPVHV